MAPYSPKYKVLAKLKQPIWLEKRNKIKKFKRQKWQGKKRFYFPRRLKIFAQDSSTYSVSKSFDNDRATRLKKTYKYLLRDKQALHFYYGGRRMKSYQLKEIASLASDLGRKKKVSSGKVFFHLLENRLEVVLYRLGLVTSLGQSRKLLASRRLKINGDLVTKLAAKLKCSDSLRIEGSKSTEILARYLKLNLPFYYFGKRKRRKLSLFSRKESREKNYIVKETPSFLSFLRESLGRLEKKKNAES